MKIKKYQKKTSAWLGIAAATMLAVGTICPPLAQAQVPARFYWKPLAGANAVPLIFESVSGNTNPFDPAHNVSADADIDATLAMAGYAKIFPLFGRAAMASVLVPMGRISGDVTVAGRTSGQSVNGFGDPMLEFVVNLLGPPAQIDLPDALRYEPGFSVDLLTDLALPIGEYDDDQPLNIGQNRWYGRIGLPIVWQLGSWIPGQRTTLEFLPVVWLFGDNDDYVGLTMETDPLFQLDAHLTRDFTEHLWGSLDGSWYNGGEATIDGITGEALDSISVGLTLGYQINDNMGLTVGYKSTINDDDPNDLSMDTFMISFVYGWHKLIEGSKRLQNE